MRSVLLEKCQRLRRFIDAATVPVENGRRIRDGFDAKALSKAVDDLHAAAFRAQRRLVSKAPVTQGTPPGIRIEQSASPDGPFTPVPVEALTPRVIAVGKGGASPTLLAALRRVTESTAFPADRWNAMQAARPGQDHERFRPGDVIPQEDLDLLRQAEELLRLEDESNPGWDAADASPNEEMVARLVKVQGSPPPCAELALPKPPLVIEEAGQQPDGDPKASTDGTLSLTEAAALYAILTGTKPDKGNASRRLADENGDYTIAYIALKARDANKRKEGRKRRELMSESDSPQQCSKCAATVRPPDTLWGSGRLCVNCMYDAGR